MNNLENILESVLFIAGNGVDASEIAEKLGVNVADVMDAAIRLKEGKYGGNSGIVVTIYNNKIQLATNPAYAEPVSSVLNPIRERELSKSMLETAAIIAYKQPVSRLDLEEIRGASSEYAIQKLLEIDLIKVVGYKDAIGKPALFGTTDEFLKRFDLSSIDDLPDYDSIVAKIRAQEIGTSADNSYLYRKDEYISEVPEEEEEMEGISFDEEDIPDFIKDDEDAVQIG
jgi:segregation and condensation protein B